MFLYYLGLGGLLFCLGLFGLLYRENLLLILFCLELMFLALCFLFGSTAHFLALETDRVFVLFLLTVFLAQSAAGLVLFLLYVRRRNSLEIDEFSELKW